MSPSRRRHRKQSKTAAHRLKRLELRDGAGCYICLKAKAINPTLDHVIPLAKGGADNYSNLKIACKKCNSHKGCALPSPEELARVRIRTTESVINTTTAKELTYEERLAAYFKLVRGRGTVTKYGPGLSTEERIALQKRDES